MIARLIDDDTKTANAAAQDADVDWISSIKTLACTAGLRYGRAV